MVNKFNGISSDSKARQDYPTFPKLPLSSLSGTNAVLGRVFHETSEIHFNDTVVCLRRLKYTHPRSYVVVGSGTGDVRDDVSRDRFSHNRIVKKGRMVPDNLF